MRLLLIEPDWAEPGSLQQTLEGREHETSVADTGFDGLRMALAEDFDAVVVDLNLPDIAGFDLLRMLRAVSDVAVVAKVEPDVSMIDTLDAGADDYVVKPYSADQIESRLRVLARRTPERATQPVLTVGRLRVDEKARVAYLGSDVLDLTKKEFDMVAYLASKRGGVVSKRELASEIWNDPYDGSDRTVDVHLSSLRRKLGETASAPRYLRTVRGVGVKLVDPTMSN